MIFNQKHTARLSLFAWLAAFAGVFLFFRGEYLLPWGFNFLLGLALSPLIGWRVAGQDKCGRFGWVALAFGGLLLATGSNMASYFCCGFGLLFLLETGWGRLNRLPAFLLVAASPVFQYVADTWSFPIRLQLSTLAGKALALAGFRVEVAGNVLVLDGAEFSVDAACMGLNLLSASLLVGLLVLARFERRSGRALGFAEAGAWMLLALGLAVFCNFNRLLALVIFRVLPGDPMHEAWGLLALLACVGAPFFFLVKWRFGAIAAAEGRAEFIPPLSAEWRADFIPPFQAWRNEFRPPFGGWLLLRWLVLAALLLGGSDKRTPPGFSAGGLQALQLPGFQSSVTADGVLKMENDSLLVYVKPPAGWLRASHDPRICWHGSGYEFHKIRKERWGGLELYTAELSRSLSGEGAARLHTAWWYDNGKTQTVEEWTWRWAGLLEAEQGGYFLINASGLDREKLAGEALKIRGKLHEALSSPGDSQSPGE